MVRGMFAHDVYIWTYQMEYYTFDRRVCVCWFYVHKYYDGSLRLNASLTKNDIINHHSHSLQRPGHPNPPPRSTHPHVKSKEAAFEFTLNHQPADGRRRRANKININIEKHRTLLAAHHLHITRALVI